MKFSLRTPDARLGAILAFPVVTGLVLSLACPSAPLFVLWVTTSIAVGQFIARATGAPGFAPIAARLILAHAVLIPAALVSTMLVARHQSGRELLRLHGAEIAARDTVQLGAGGDDNDIILPSAGPALPPWHVTFRRTDGRWVVDTARTSVESLEFSGPTVTGFGLGHFGSNGASVGLHNNGRLAASGDEVLVTLPDGSVVDTVRRMTSSDGSPVLASRSAGARLLALKRTSEASLVDAALVSGEFLAQLPLDASGRAPIPGSVPLAHLLRVRRLPEGSRVFGEPSGLGARLAAWFVSEPRYLLSAVAPLRLVQRVPSVATSEVAVGDSLRLTIRHAGTRWVVDVVPTTGADGATSALAVLFVRNPRPVDVPLSGHGDQGGPDGLGLLSSRLLPPPLDFAYSGAAGLDTMRYALLGDLTYRRRDLVLTVDSTSHVVPVSPDRVRIPVRIAPWARGRADGSVLVSAVRIRFASWGELLAIAVGLLLVLGATGSLVATLPARRTPLTRDASRTLATLLAPVFSLLLSRLILGARLSLSAPFNPVGLETAIGLVLAIGLVAAALLSWHRWAPLLSERATALHRLRSALARTSWAGRSAWWHHEDGRALLMLVGGALLLAVVAPAAVAKAVFVASSVVAIWIAVARIGGVLHVRGGAVSHEALQVITRATVRAEQAPAASMHVNDAMLILLTVVWACTVVSALAGVGALVLCVGMLHRGWLPSSIVGIELVEQRRRAIAPLILSTATCLALRQGSQNGALAAFLLVLAVTLVALRLGRALGRRLDAVHAMTVSGEALSHDAVAHFRGVGSLLLPLAMLSPLIVIDMGLLLVVLLPIGIAALLAVGWGRLPVGTRLVVGGVATALVAILTLQVLRPPLGAIADVSATPAARDAAFERMQRVFGLIRVPIPAVQDAMARSAARAVATIDLNAAERLMAVARPGTASRLLGPSIEQVWGARSHGAVGWLGRGQGSAPSGGHGIAAPVSYAENSFAVFVLYEHGALGGLVVLVPYLLLLVALWMALRSSDLLAREHAHGDLPGALRATRALAGVAVMLITVPAIYVVLSNVAWVPLTGQNIPLLGLNAWSDVAFGAGTLGMLLVAVSNIQQLGSGT